MKTKTLSSELHHKIDVYACEPKTVVLLSGKTLYTCPMHPEAQQDHPAGRLKCGMTLEPKTVAAGTDDEETAELREMTKRFRIGAALTLPVFV